MANWLVFVSLSDAADDDGYVITVAREGMMAENCEHRGYYEPGRAHRTEAAREMAKRVLRYDSSPKFRGEFGRNAGRCARLMNREARRGAQT